ncbi:hypothetical protein BJX99DRAFT_265703, partial [Aspergillus californicus]
MSASTVSSGIVDAPDGRPVTTLTIVPADTSANAVTTRSVWPNGDRVDTWPTYTDVNGVMAQISMYTTTRTGDPDEPTTSSTSSTTSSTTASTTTDSTSSGTLPTMSGPPVTVPSNSRSTSTRTTAETTMPTISTTHRATTTSSPGSNASSSSGVSDSTLAGAILGSIFGTAILILLLTFLFIRRRRQSTQTTSPEDNTPEKQTLFTDTNPMGVPVSNNKNPAAPALAFSLDSIIRTPAEDSAVRDRIMTLVDRAEIHVNIHYAPTSSVHLSHEAKAKLAKYDSDALPASVMDMVDKSSDRREIIKHVLVRILLKAIRPGGQLLPCLFALEPEIENVTPSIDKALYTWRMLTAHLYSQDSHTLNPKHKVARARAIQTLIREFTSAFAPYARETSASAETKRNADLEIVANQASEVGIWLFAQRCGFEFIWERSLAGFSVVPDVVKVCDEDGVRLEKPFAVVKGVVGE